MKKDIDEFNIYEFNDRQIVHDICTKLSDIRKSCCYSQQDLSDMSGVSIACIKRIETCATDDITMGTLLKLMRTTGMLEGFARLLPKVPQSPFLDDTNGRTLKKRCRKSYRTITHEK